MLIHVRDAIVCIVIASVICFWGMRLGTADWTSPFSYHSDTLAMIPVVKETVERSNYRTTPRLGAPGIQQLYDFPISEPLHLSIIWLIGQVIRNPIVTFNLYYLLTFPFTAASTFFVFRNFSYSRPASHCGAILFAFLPYHIARGYVHYFLSAYFIVPLTAMTILWIARGRLPFFRASIEGKYRFSMMTRDTLAAMLIAAATAMSGAYYAFFGCALLVVAGLYGWLAVKTVRAMISACLVVGLIVSVGIVQYIPTFEYQSQFGKNSEPHTRTSEEAEEYPLKITQLLLPIKEHNSKTLQSIQLAYDTPTRLQQNENKTTALGLIGACGFVILMVVAVFPIGQSAFLRPLAVLSVVCVLIGISGGIGSLFSQFVTPQFRAYNRIAVYIAFFSLMASCGLIDRLIPDRWRLLRVPAFILITCIGIWDQTGYDWFRSRIRIGHEAIAERSRTDEEFFSTWELSYPDSMVFCLPYLSFPEEHPKYKLLGYDHARGYLHTKTARWSYGAMKGREADQWQRDVLIRPIPQLLDGLSFRGFDTIFFDKRGYDPIQGPAKLMELRKAAGMDCPMFVHEDGMQVLLDLQPYRERRRRELGEEYEKRAANENEVIRFLWLDGFVSFQAVGEEWKHHGCRQKGELMILNPTQVSRTINVEAIFRTALESDSQLEIDGEVWRESFPINRSTPPSNRIITVPPGRHCVTFRCRLSDEYQPTETRRLAFFVGNFRTD